MQQTLVQRMSTLGRGRLDRAHRSTKTTEKKSTIKNLVWSIFSVTVFRWDDLQADLIFTIDCNQFFPIA